MFNQAQLGSLLRDALKIGGLALANHGYQQAGTFLTGDAFFGFAMTFFGMLCSRWIHADDVVADKKITVANLIAIAAGATIIFGGAMGCQTSKLAPGGVYAPVVAGTTNAVAAPEIGLYYADAAYKLAYDAVDGALVFEMNNRAALQKISPAIKTELDKIRPTVWQIEQRWALARQVYKTAPTPTGLTELQTIIAEIGRLVPVAQSQLSAAVQNSTK